MSPFRKRKGTLQKLKVQEDDEEDKQLEKLDDDMQKLKPIYDKVLENYAQR